MFTLDDIPEDKRGKLKVNGTEQSLEDFAKMVDRKPRQFNFSKQDVRKKAIKVLAVMADINQAERVRVLYHAMKMNEV